MPNPWMRFSQKTPAFVLLLGAFCYAVMAVAVKKAEPIPPGQISLLRFVFGLLVMGALHQGGIVRISFQNRQLLILRGLMAGASVLCYFTAISMIGTSAATLFNNCFPFFTALFALWAGQERAEPRIFFPVAMALGGLFLVLAPGAGAVAFGLGPVLGLLSALLAGSAFVVIRELRRTEDAWAIFTAMCLGGVLISLPMALLDLRMPRGEQWGWLLLMGACGMISQLLMNHAMRFLAASAGAVVTTATTGFAALFGYMFLDETHPWTFFAGAGLIFGAAGYIAALGRRSPHLSRDAQGAPVLESDEEAERAPPE